MRTTRSRRRRTIGYPGGGQAARRQPRPGRLPGPALRGGRPQGIPHRAAREPRRRRRGRDVRPRRRPSGAHHRRPDGGHRGAGAGGRDCRRHAHRARAGGYRERRPAARLRPREGADPHQGRRGRAGAHRQAGLHARFRARCGRAGAAGADRQHVDRRHVHRPHDGGASREHRDRGDGGTGRGPRHRGHRLGRARHRGAHPRAGRRHRGGQRGARLPDAHPPDRRRAAVRGQAGHRPAVPAGHRTRASRSSA